MNPRLEWILSEYEVEVLLTFCIHCRIESWSALAYSVYVCGGLSWHWLFSVTYERAKKATKTTEKVTLIVSRNSKESGMCARDVNKTSRLKSIHLREQDSFGSSGDIDDSMRFNGMSRQNPITVTMRNSRDLSKYTLAEVHRCTNESFEFYNFLSLLYRFLCATEFAMRMLGFCVGFSGHSSISRFSNALRKCRRVLLAALSLNYAILSTLESHCLLACAAHLLSGGRHSHRINPLQVEKNRVQK